MPSRGRMAMCSGRHRPPWRVQPQLQPLVKGPAVGVGAQHNAPPILGRSDRPKEEAHIRAVRLWHRPRNDRACPEPAMGPPSWATQPHGGPGAYQEVAAPQQQPAGCWLAAGAAGCSSISP